MKTALYYTNEYWPGSPRIRTVQIYSLHEPQIHCIAKVQDQQAYEYGSKASVASTARREFILAPVIHEKPVHNTHTLGDVLEKAMAIREQSIELVVCVRGYRGKKQVGETDIILRGTPLKRDTRSQRDKEHRRCRRRAAVEPLIDHLKQDHRLDRRLLKSAVWDQINILIATFVRNLKKWLGTIFYAGYIPTYSRERVLGHDRKQVILTCLLIGVLCRFIQSPHINFASTMPLFKYRLFRTSSL